MRLTSACLAVIVAIAVPAARSAEAAPLTAGDLVRLSDGAGTTGGGEFNIWSVANPQAFITFCLQRTQYIDFTNAFRVDAISTYVAGDPAAYGGNRSGRDPLSQQTAYLYTMFTAGRLAGYNYAIGAARTASANALQNAFWMFEQELAMSATNPFVRLANQAVSSGAWSGLGQVRVLNLSLKGAGAQDQLYIARVPEPAPLMLMGSVVAAWLARRWTRRATA